MWFVRCLFYFNIIETAIIGYKIETRVGIGVMNLNLLKSAEMMPSHRTLRIKQDAVPRAHYRHLRQVVSVIVAKHCLAQGRATVTKHMDLGQITAQTPLADVVGSNLIDTTFLNCNLHPLATGEFARFSIVTLVQGICGNCTICHQQQA